ncbi:MAG: hypothetical protein IPN75_20000, partial [Dechloromonas sp.]|nr:hypothetical protein [Candidatus Dechloromonas phosphorivorans]
MDSLGTICQITQPAPIFSASSALKPGDIDLALRWQQNLLPFSDQFLGKVLNERSPTRDAEITLSPTAQSPAAMITIDAVP